MNTSYPHLTATILHRTLRSCWLCKLLLLGGLALALFTSPAYAADADVGSPPVLVKDLNPNNADSQTYFTAAGDHVLIHVYDGVAPSPLWWSDGTPEGTVFLGRIEASNPVQMNGLWFFVGSDGQTGPELWRTDGTAAGTQLVKDIFPGPHGSLVYGFITAQLFVINDTLFFVANEDVHGIELWQSDGSAAGTVLVKDTVPGLAGGVSNVSKPAIMSDTLFFWVRKVGNPSAEELWRSDGTVQGATMIQEFTFSSYIGVYDLTAVGNQLFFTVGTDLWRTDGTTAGTLLLKHFVATNSNCGNTGCGQDSFGPRYLTAVNGLLFLQANDGVSGVEIWRSDGTPAGTLLAADTQSAASTATEWPMPLGIYKQALIFRSGASLWISDANGVGATRLLAEGQSLFYSFDYSPFVVANGLGFFVVNAGLPNLELWRTDGTPAGTVPVRVINDSAPYLAPALFTINDTLFLTANIDGYGSELWRSDGTTAGTTLVADIRPGPRGSAPPYGWLFIPAKGRVFFRADDGLHGAEPWVSDGTPAGTKLLRDFQTTPFGSKPQRLSQVNNLLVFRTQEENTFQFWKSDGSVTGTVLLFDSVTNNADFSLSTTSPYVTQQANDPVYLTYDNTLWESDSTLTTLRPILNPVRPLSFATLGNTLFFVNGFLTGSFENYGLWRLDSAGAAPVLVKAAPVPGFGQPLVRVNDRLYFFAIDENDSSITHLWRSDGTADGTQPLPIGIPSSYIPTMVNLQGTLLFLFYNHSSASELWRSDGTADGTVLVKTIPAFDDYGSPPLLLYPVNNRVLFVVRAAVEHLWASDGTADGTILLKEGNPNLQGPSFQELTVVNGRKLFFTADDGVHGRELWMSDGTMAGTVLVKDIAPGAASANPTGLRQVGDILLFAATDGSGQQALWRTNDAGSRVQKVLNLGELRDPAEFTVAGSRLYFSAASPAVGRELWAIPITGTAALSITAPAQRLGTALGQVTLPIQLANQGMSKATGVRLTVTLDERLTYVGDNTNITPLRNGNTLTWNLVDMGFWYQSTVELYVRAPAAAPGATFPVTFAIAANETGSVEGQSALLLAPYQRYLPTVARQ